MSVRDPIASLQCTVTGSIVSADISGTVSGFDTYDPLLKGQLIWGDGSVTDVVVPFGVSTHSYVSTGTYVVVFWVYTTKGRRGRAESTVSVDAPYSIDSNGPTLTIGTEENGHVEIVAGGPGAELTLRASNAASDGVGGEISILSGASAGGNGGQILLFTGNDTGGGDSGSISIATGGAAFNGDGGSTGEINIRTGNSTVADFHGGDINIVAGQGILGGGKVLIQSGARTGGSGSHGSVQLYSADGASSAELNNSGFNISGMFKVGSYQFANLPTAAVGMMAVVTNSNTVTWGATIAGGGANAVLAFYNGTNWTVAGK